MSELPDGAVVYPEFDRIAPAEQGDVFRERTVAPQKTEIVDPGVQAFEMHGYIIRTF